MLVERDVLSRLEWDRVLEAVSTDLRTPMGHEELDALVPLGEGEAIIAAQERTDEMRAAHAIAGRLPIVAVEHPAAVLEELQVAGRVLTGRDIYETVRLLSVGRATVRALEALDPDRFPRLAREAEGTPDLSPVIDTIEGNVTPAGGLEDDASPELARIRREIRHLSESVTRILEGLLKAEWTEHVLRDKYVTSRNNRFVVPVRTDTPRRLPGIVHGASASQRTVFVEPMETVEINNQLVRLRDDEEQEVERILAGYTELMRAYHVDIADAARRLGRLDLLEAVALWAERARAVRPEFISASPDDPATEGRPTSSGGLHFVGARHPVLEQTLAAAGRAIVPLDVDLAGDARVLVISGPNAGGKTVALKTIGLLTLIAHAGLPVPAAEARMPLFSRIEADIGDEQSIHESLSTFSSHVRNLAGMVRASRPPALALIDEIGTGTDPAEGAALGVAVLDRLRRNGIHVVATTHHAAVKAWAYRAPDTLNAACDFDEKSMRPTYRLVPGVAGASIGLTMARQLGMDEDIVADAQRRLDPSGAEAAQLLDSLRALASDIEGRRGELEDKRRALEREALARDIEIRRAEERRQAEWQTRLDQLQRNFRADAERSLSRLTDARERRALDKERARRERELKAKYSDENAAASRQAPPPPEWAPEVGGKVYVVSLSKEGVIRAIRGRRVEVALGHATFTVPLEELRPLGDPASAASAGPGTASGAAGKSAPQLARRRGPTGTSGVSAELGDREVPLEIHLLGMRVDEALGALDRYVDDAVLAGYREIRIVHGFGTGALKKAVREYLDEHHEVISWREADLKEGGGGATVARLEEDDLA